MRRLNNRGRMKGDFHVRFSESLRGRFPRATRQPNVETKTDRWSEYMKAESQTAGGRVYPLTKVGLISVGRDEETIRRHITRQEKEDKRIDQLELW